MQRQIFFACVVPLVAGCSGPWDDLAARYPAKSADLLSNRGQTVVLVGTNHRGAYSYQGLASFQLDQSGVRMALAQPISILNPPLHIPVASVSACSRISWIPEFDTPIWVDDAKVEIVLKGYEKETLEWCKTMSIPIVRRETESKWLRGEK